MSLLFLLIEHQPMHNLLSANGLMIVMHQRCIAPTCQVFIQNLTLSIEYTYNAKRRQKNVSILLTPLSM